MNKIKYETELEANAYPSTNKGKLITKHMKVLKEEERQQGVVNDTAYLRKRHPRQ